MTYKVDSFMKSCCLSACMKTWIFEQILLNCVCIFSLGVVPNVMNPWILGNMKQFHNQMKTMTDQTFEMDDRIADIEKLSPMMGVFEWRIENYKYHSLNSEFLTSPEFITHLNGYSCYMSVQWFGRFHSFLIIKDNCRLFYSEHFTSLLGISSRGPF